MSVPSSPIPTPVHAPAWTRFFPGGEDTGSRPGKVCRSASTPSEEQIKPDTVLDQRFRVLSQLGCGGMASVYLCEDLALRSQAAVKILQSADLDLRRRFLDEVTILANLRHPHLVQVLAVGETPDGAPYMAMEHLGKSLDQQLRAKGPLPWREAIEVTRQVASALETLHRAGVIHRDVKPSNIAELRGVTGERRVKLIDLGIARIEELARIQGGGEPLPPRRRTAAGKIIGTPGYVPPEAGLAAPDARFDVYSLGVTLYQLCTGKMPDPAELQRMEEARPGCGIPEGLEAVVRRAMAILPEDRFATVAELRRELAAIQSDGAESLASDLPLFDGCYELIELIGVGAKAEVYWAYHRDARCYVALKILREEALECEEDRARFVREARVLAAVDDPAIPKLIECRTGPGVRRPFIAMQLRRGQTVAEISPEKLGASEVIAVGLQLAAALTTLHQQGVLHRDLNRSNVLIDRRDGEPVASLIDFGEAELLDRFYALTDERYPTPPEARTRPESEGLRNLEWTAPEAKAGHGWTPRSDVYSLGRLLYGLLTGKRPTMDEEGEWISPAEHVADCPGPLANALVAALQVDPAHRLSVAQLIVRLRDADEDLREIELAERMEEMRVEAATSSEPEIATAVSSSPRVGPGWRWVLAIVAALSLVLLGVWIGQSGSSTPGLDNTRVALAWASRVPEEHGAPLPAEAEPAEEAKASRAAMAPPEPDEPDLAEGDDAEEVVADLEETPESEALPTKAKKPAGSASVQKARQRALSKKRSDLSGCLSTDAGAMIVTINVGAEGQIANVSHDAPNLPSMVTKCIERQLRHVRVKPGAPSQHRLSLGEV